MRLKAAMHLIVVSHGLRGRPNDLACLKTAIELRDKAAVVLLSEANHENTLDGVAAGGKRLAEDVIRTIELATSEGRCPLKLSIVGNSLGGLYARWAVAHLFDAGTGLLAGLEPEAFVTIATPHLGVRSYTYIGLPVPQPLQRRSLAALVAGKSGEDLLLLDDLEPNPAAPAKDGDATAGASVAGSSGSGPLLLRMATDERFLAPLRAFKRRAAYANKNGDFLVPFETAVFSAPQQRDGAVAAAGAGLPLLRALLGAPQGRITLLENPAPLAAVASEPSSYEARMAAGLDSVGWSKVSVEFGGAIPLSHNKICALGRRGPVAEFLYKSGRNVMDHLADYITTS